MAAALSRNQQHQWTQARGAQGRAGWSQLCQGKVVSAPGQGGEVLRTGPTCWSLGFQLHHWFPASKSERSRSFLHRIFGNLWWKNTGMLFNPLAWDKIWDGPQHSELWENFASLTDCPVGFQKMKKLFRVRKTLSFVASPWVIPHIQRQEQVVFPLWNPTKPCRGCGQGLSAVVYSPAVVKSVWGLGLPYCFDVETEGNRLRGKKKGPDQGGELLELVSCSNDHNK